MSAVVFQSLTAVLETVPPLTLDCVSATPSLDEGRAPYGEIVLVIHTPAEADAERIDPRDELRVTVTAMQEWIAPTRPPQTRVFDMILHERVIDYEAGEMTLTLRTDEAKLIDDGLIATAVDTSAYPVESSLRSVVDLVLATIGAALEAGTDDADFTRTANATNVVRNPSANTNLTDYSFGASSGSAVATRQTAGGPAGAATFFRATASSTLGAGSGLSVGSTAVAAIQVSPSKPWRESLWVRVSTAMNVTADVLAYTSAGVLISAPALVTVALSANTWTKILLGTFTTPATTDRLVVRAYTGSPLASGGTFDVAAIRVSEPTGAHDDDYFDGSTLDAYYTHSWIGAVGGSQSKRVRLDDRSIDLLDRQPGQPSWDFLQPLVQQAGLRLFCDEARTWRLVNSNSYLVDGAITIAEGSNLTGGSDEISLAGDWATGVVVTYSWTDIDGVSHTAYDAAGTSTRVTLIEWARPYPGPGAAQIILDRMAGRGRVLNVPAVAELTATPGQYTQAVVPNAPIQTGIASAVSWTIPEALMTVDTRGLIDTPTTAWIFLPAEAWTDSPAGASWISETV